MTDWARADRAADQAIAAVLAELRRLPQAREGAPIMPAPTREDHEMWRAEDRAAQRRHGGDW